MSIDAKLLSPAAGKKFYKNKIIKKLKNYRIWHLHFTPLPGRPCGADFYTFWLVGSYGRRSHPCQILSRLVKGLGGYGPPKSGVSHWLWMSLLQECYALTCYTVTRLGDSANQCVVLEMWVPYDCRVFVRKPRSLSCAWTAAFDGHWCFSRTLISLSLWLCLSFCHLISRSP